MNKTLSVVIPAYNEEKYIRKTLESLKSQNQKDFELIVVDNGSTDSTAKVARDLGVKVVDFPDEKGAAAARQRGIEVAKGEIIAFTDADTEVSSDWLETIREMFAQNDLIAVGGLVLPKERSLWNNLLFWLYDVFLMVNQAFGKPLLWGNNLAIRSDALHAVGGFDKNLATSEDWELALRLKKHFDGTKKVVYNNKLKVFTSTRKTANVSVFLKYFFDGVGNYFNIVILGRAKSNQMRTVR